MEHFELSLFDMVVWYFGGDEIQVLVVCGSILFLDVLFQNVDVLLQKMQVAFHSGRAFDIAMMCSHVYKWNLRPVIVKKDRFEIL